MGTATNFVVFDKSFQAASLGDASLIAIVAAIQVLLHALEELLRQNRKEQLGKNIGQNIAGCSLMCLMPLISLSNCDYELIFYLRLRLGPIHSNQVMGTDPVGSHHGTRNSRSNSINPAYPY